MYNIYYCDVVIVMSSELSQFVIGEKKNYRKPTLQMGGVDFGYYERH